MGGGFGLPGERRMGCGILSFPLKGVFDRARPLGGWLSHRRSTMSAGIGPRCAFAGSFAGFAFLWGRQIDAGLPRLGQANRYGLFRRAGTVLSMANMLDFLADKLSCLRARRFAFPFVAACSLDGFLFWHGCVPFLKTDART